MANTHILCVHRSVGGDDGLYYACAAFTGSGSGLDWNCPRRPMYRSSLAGPALAVFEDKIWCVYATTSGYIKSTTWDTDTESWDADVYTGGRTSATPALAVIQGQLFCLYRGYEGDNRLKWCRHDGTNWIQQENLLCNASSIAGPAALVYGGTLYTLFPKHGGEIYGCTFIPGGTVPDYWSDQWRFEPDGPGTTSNVSLAAFDSTIYCAHRGADTKNSRQIWTSTLKAEMEPKNRWMRLSIVNKDISNQDFNTEDGPALAVAGSTLWTFYRATTEEPNLYYARWHKSDPWSSSYWENEATAPNNPLWYEPAVLAVDNAIFDCCATGAAKKQAAKPKAKKPQAKKKAKSRKPKRVAARRKSPARSARPKKKAAKPKTTKPRRKAGRKAVKKKA